jgi:phosphoglycolate phosphatase
VRHAQAQSTFCFDAATAMTTASRPQRYDLIAFDWDGTLYNSTGLITRCIQNAVVAVGGQRPSDTAAAWVIGMALPQALARVAPDVPRERYPQLNAAYRDEYLAHHDDIELFEGVLPMLAALRERHHWLTVATGKSRAGLNRVLEAPQFHGVFDGSRTADETAGKPDPRMLHELMREFGAEPGRTLMVGDTTHDLQMARNAGCDCVAVAYGAHDPAEFEPFSPRFIARDSLALADWLIQHA